MKTRNKLLTLLILSAGAATATAFINKAIKISATSKNVLNDPKSLCYKWRLGNIHYTKSGNGKPLLLIHDLTPASSGYEWTPLVNKLSENYTVYTIDLLGCGRSEKPNLTYTNYLYVQLLSDFIKSEIGHRTDVIATGASAALQSWHAEIVPSYSTGLCSSIQTVFSLAAKYLGNMQSYISSFWIFLSLGHCYTTLQPAGRP